MNYTLHQLQIFLTVTRTGSITKAAEELHLTQPAVSIQMRNLQDQFDIPLTEIIGRRLHITPFGREIASTAENLLKEVENIENKALAHKGLLAGKLVITSVSTGKYVMPYFLSGFMREHPGIDLTMDVTNKTRVVESLEKNEVDFALVSILPETFEVESEELLENTLYLVAGKAYGPTEHIRSPKDLSELPLILRESGSGTRSVMERFMKKHGIEVRKRLELSSNEAVKQALIAGLGLSVMPLIGIRNEILNGDLRILPMEGLPLTTNWNLIWLKGKSFGPVSSAYLDYLRKEKMRIIRDRFTWYETFEIQHP
ncbi:MAG: LysR family transcriptional regulator [Bacteroidota bacterium]|nr:LysR family transcriptional regulator [Bacteroidota bacterium]MDX5426956.1 LysR family transcriptional regulator [Bacteroidota bacterium]MDX5447303.1 LysR family transcriptional regulator [Bacteroidota bacterium]MDX5504944.1 LysR family transcriptional regulator [Bacteroidota bacterium]